MWRHNLISITLLFAVPALAQGPEYRLQPVAVTDVENFTITDNEGLPGGYKDAGAGWRRKDALDGDLDRYIKLLCWYEELCQQWPQIEAWCVYTQGFVGWEHFQFNGEWNPFVDALLGG